MSENLSYPKKQLKDIEKKIDAALSEMLKDPSMENISTLNNLRTNKEIVKSRIENYGKEVFLPNFITVSNT
jgi:hypothetical protein